MGEIVNLNRCRKTRGRQEQADKAEANRAKFGRTKAERQAGDRARTREEHRHEGRRIEKSGDPPPKKRSDTNGLVS